METKRCKDCWFALNGECGLWGFPLLYDQRACKQYTDEPKLERLHEYPTGCKMTSTSFPENMLNIHDLSDKRHTLIFKTACVQGVWYIGQRYGRHYDSMYGAGWACGIYDGDYATEQEAINAKINALIESETYYRCDEAVQFLKTKRFENKQLSLFD